MLAAWVLLGLTLGVVALLSVPIEFNLSFAYRESWRGDARVRWLFGLVRFSATGSGRPGTGAKDEADGGRKRRKGTARRTWRRVRAGVGVPGAVRRAVRLLVDLLSGPRVSVRGWARVGLEDPADTGMLWGVVGPLSAFTGLRLEPVFDEQVLRGEGVARIRIFPAQLLGLVLGFVLSPVTLRAAWAAARA